MVAFDRKMPQTPDTRGPIRLFMVRHGFDESPQNQAEQQIIRTILLVSVHYRASGKANGVWTLRKRLKRAQSIS